jgi:hypothetical protein
MHILVGILNPFGEFDIRDSVISGRIYLYYDYKLQGVPDIQKVLKMNDFSFLFNPLTRLPGLTIVGKKKRDSNSKKRHNMNEKGHTGIISGP